MSEKTSSRRALLAGLGSGTVTLLAGCGGRTGTGGGGGETTANTATPTPGKPTLRFWSKEVETKRVKTISQIAKSFPGANFETRFVSEGNMPSQLSSARAAGNLPGIVQATSTTTAKLFDQGLATSKPNTAVVEEIGEDKFLQGPLNFFKAGGGYHTVPHNAWPALNIYRQDLFEKNGLSSPRTWKEIRKAAETLHDPDNNMYGIAFGTKGSFYTPQTFTPFAKANGAQVFNKNGDIVFDSQAMVEALDFYGNTLYQYTPPAKQNYTQTRKTYESGQAGMVLWSSYMLDTVVKNNMQSKSGISPFVERDQQATFGQAIGIQITEAANDTAAAKEFANYLVGGDPWDPYVKWLHLAPMGMLPVVKETYQNSSWQDNRFLSAWEDQLPKIKNAQKKITSFALNGSKFFPAYGQIAAEGLVADAVVRVIDGDDPDTVAKEAAQKMRKAIS